MKEEKTNSSLSEPLGYELFCDSSYYDMYCVRNINDKRFESPTSFHFNKKEDAEKFKELIERAK